MVWSWGPWVGSLQVPHVTVITWVSPWPSPPPTPAYTLQGRPTSFPLYLGSTQNQPRGIVLISKTIPHTAWKSPIVIKDYGMTCHSQIQDGAAVNILLANKNTMLCSQETFLAARTLLQGWKQHRSRDPCAPTREEAARGWFRDPTSTCGVDMGWGREWEWEGFLVFLVRQQLGAELGPPPALFPCCPLSSLEQPKHQAWETEMGPWWCF